MPTEEQSRLYWYAMRYLKIRWRTIAEMERYLVLKKEKTGAQDEDIAHVIAHLQEIDLLNDRTFVEKYVNTRSKVKPKGKSVLMQELKRLGVKQDIISNYFESHTLPELELAIDLLEKKWRSWHSLDPEIRKQKAIQFLMRRGFSYNVINTALANTATEG